MTGWQRNGGTSSLSPASNPGLPSSGPSIISAPSSLSGCPRFVAWTLVSILMVGCAILAAAILWKARTLPRTPRAFWETRFLLETNLRESLRKLRVSGDRVRDVGAVKTCPSEAPARSTTAPFGGCDRDGRSRQLWKLLLGVICPASFLDRTGTRPLGGLYLGWIMPVL